MSVLKPVLRSALLFSLLAFTAFGCNKKEADNKEQNTVVENTVVAPQSITAVAVIDVNEIARSSGKLDEINLELNKKEAELNTALESLRKLHQDQITTMKDGFSEDESKTAEQQQDALNKLKTIQASEYNRRWQDHRLQLSRLKQRLDEQFLNEVRPLASEIAEQKGLSVVIRKENIFTISDQCDITADVSQSYIEAHPAEEKEAVVAKMPDHGGSFVPQNR